ncbi:MAG: N-acetylmuramoyl-L-alanine amidase [Elusimicrobiaceae bacterium]|nr:N-acetylmuramoyl-L-alanine amidase [Elusimicrobiaceae bacterium]
MKMLKKIFFIFIILNFFSAGYAQIKTPLEIAGKKGGKVKVILRQEEPFIAARSFGRSLGMQSTYFAASGRLELMDGSKKALLINSQPYVFINKQKKTLSQAPFLQEGIFYAPLSFFNDFSSYDTAYQNNKIVVQRRYNLSLSQQINNQDFSKLIFNTKGELPFKIIKTTKGKVELFLPGAIVKQDEVLSPKNNFFYRIRINQKAKGVQIMALLKKNAKNWDFYYNGKDFIFEISSKPLKRNFVEKTEDTSLVLDRPSVLQEDKQTNQPISKQTSKQEDNQAGKEVIELGEDFFAASTTKVPATSAVSVSPALSSKSVPGSAVAAVKTNKGKLKILIDPGHGGKDPGAARKGSLREKELNLKVAKQVYEFLKKEKNVEVKMTRNDDTFISLGERARMSVKQDSDIFVSIHTNAAKRASASGFEVYFRSDKASDAEAAQTAALENEALQYEGKTSSGLSFADLLLQSLATNENINQSSKLAAHIRMLAFKESGKIGIKVFNNSAIKQANFYVLRGVKCPAVLVEMGYISNASDRKRLNNKNTQTLLAKTIAQGILTYAKEEGWK